MPQYELTSVDDKGEDANQKDDRGGRAERNARIKRVAIIVGTALLGLLTLIMLIWGISALLGYQLLTWEQETFIESIPGVKYRTNSSEDGTPGLIWVHSSPNNAFLRWVDVINEAFKPYRLENRKTKKTIMNCDYERKPPAGKVCNVDPNVWFPCVQSNHYNFHKSSPCVFLKFKEIPDWEPEFYNSSSHLPENMPKEVKESIQTALDRNSLEINTVWVSCEGENVADVENLGKVKYIPQNGFPGYYFPYKEIDGYLSPIVSVHFERPTAGVIINVICKLWAPNIMHEGAERLAWTRFALLID